MNSKPFAPVGVDEPAFDRIEAANRPANQPASKPGSEDAKPRKPVLALMGEFSAGKSTLTNLLIGSAALPVNVTATQLPPVWISKGDESPYRVALDGQEFDIDLERLEEVAVVDTSHIRIFHDAEILDLCDIIDMPGISDPNMDAEVWRRVIHHADAVVWCTHATQAWRQSEAAVWAMLPPSLHPRSFLLLTRMDKILSERDRGRVMKRVDRETRGLFRALFPISLTRAIAAAGDPEKWESSGAGPFRAALVNLLEEIAAGAEAPADAAPAAGGQAVARRVLPNRIRPRSLGVARPSGRRPATGEPTRPTSTI